MAADPEHAALETAELELRSPSDTLAVERPSFTGYPFTLGVASGSPLTTGVVLWTRLAPEPLGGGGAGPDAIVVCWELAEDEGFGRSCRVAVSTRCRRGGTASMFPSAAWRRATGTSTASWRATR